MRHLILPLLALLALAGCSGPSQTRAAFESDHPYAKKVMEMPAVDAQALTIVRYEDMVPTIGFDGNNYQRSLVIYTLAYDAQGKVVAREDQR